MSSYTSIQNIVRNELDFEKLGDYDYQGHSFRTAMLYLSFLVYLRWDFVDKSLKKINGYVRHRVYDIDSTEAILVEFENDIVVAFRGTEKKVSDYVTILQFWQSRYMKTKTHTGFKSSILKIQDCIMYEVEQFRQSGKRIHYTGHSMGAALATLMCIYNKPDACVAFASPRTVTGVYYRSYFDKINFIRVNTSFDFVTWIPFPIPGISNFRHVGPEIRMSCPINISNHGLKVYIRQAVNEYTQSQKKHLFNEQFEKFVD